MDLLNHDLAHEFPQHLEKMRSLKVSEPHFAKLFAEYDDCNHAVAKYELGAAVIGDDALEVLKKQRLNLKDQIYQRLQLN